MDSARITARRSVLEVITRSPWGTRRLVVKVVAWPP